MTSPSIIVEVRSDSVLGNRARIRVTRSFGNGGSTRKGSLQPPGDVFPHLHARGKSNMGKNDKNDDGNVLKHAPIPPTTRVVGFLGDET